MPNHVTNVIKVAELGGKSLDQVRRLLIDSNGKVNFNMIKPMPDCLEDFNPRFDVIHRAKVALGVDAITCYPSFREELGDEDLMQLSECIDVYRQTGHIYWYDWCRANWGTKWNAYDQPEAGFSKDATEFRFSTAWNHPIELVVELSKLIPEVKFFVQYADEDIGCNCGKYWMKGGEESRHESAYLDKANGSSKWTKFAFELVYPGVDPRSYGYDENWRYSDEVYDDFVSQAED